MHIRNSHQHENWPFGFHKHRKCDPGWFSETVLRWNGDKIETLSYFSKAVMSKNLHFMSCLHLFFPSKPCFLCSAGHTGADRVVWAVRHMWRVSELRRSSLWLVCAAQHVSSLFIFTHTVSGKSMLFVYFKFTISITFESYSEKFRNDHRDHFQMAQRLFALWWWTSATASRCVYLSMLNPQMLLCFKYWI